MRIVTPDRCGNRSYPADYLEKIVWEKVESILLQPELLIREMERRKQTGSQIAELESELRAIEGSLRELASKEQKLVKDSLYDEIGEETFRVLHRDLLAHRKRLEADKLQKKKQIWVAGECKLDVEGIKRFCELAATNIKNFGFREKRLALEALQIKVWLDGFHIAIKGVIPASGQLVSMPS